MTASRYRFQDPALLGTVVEFAFDMVGSGTDDNAADAAHDRVADHVAESLLGELRRLQSVFNAFDPDSELCRWRRRELAGTETSDEFADLMNEALRWQRWSAGLFNPLAGELSAEWAQAEASGRQPDPERLIELAAAIAAPRFEMIDDRPVPVTDCGRLNLNALAKGWIVDRASETIAYRFREIDNLLVNAGRRPEPPGTRSSQSRHREPQAALRQRTAALGHRDRQRGGGHQRR